ncbi:CorA metal ion transporter [Coemansia aciculifera]|uniref:CorA metal ion transporter n=1 Tax=Coemansia aciculifera TaxID=417176 RepID=A0A9W8IP67_9FUNG|nr:CorA metal ion transporter [Coemansia aciculifera]
MLHANSSPQLPPAATEASRESTREPAVPSTARARPRASAPALGAGGSQNKARVDFGALKQWAGTGKVKRRPTANHHRRYRLGQWQSRSTCSWNPPNTPHNARGTSLGASNGHRSLVSVDISHKPSESRRSSIISLQSGGGGNASENESDSDDEGKGPLTQMLLKENDEIWNNSAFRFTFYSPVTGTVRSTDVQTLRTDHADGLDALIRLATEDFSTDNSSSSDNSSSDNTNGASGGPAVPVIAQPPQLSVTSADSVPDIVVAEASAASTPDNEYLHPNYVRRQQPRAGKGQAAKHRSSAAAPGTSSAGAEAGKADSQQSQIFWLDIMDPTDSEILALSRVFDLHPLTTEELMLMRDEGLLQDTYKSFRHYDVICYRTSAVSATTTQTTQPTTAGGAGAAATTTEAATTAADDNNVSGSTMTKRRSFVRDIVHRVHSPWGADEGPDHDHDDLFASDQLSISEKSQLGERRGQHLFSPLLAAGSRIADLFRLPRAAEHMAVPEISLGPSPRSSFLPNNHGAAPEMRESSGDEALDEPVPFYVIVLGNGVITLHYTKVPHVRNTIARLMLDEELIRLTPDYITYLLLDDITDTLVPTTRLLELEVDAIDELVLILTRAEHDDVLKRIGIERRHALWLVRLLHGKAEVLRSIERRIHAKVATDSPKSPYRLPPARRRARSTATATAAGIASRLADDEDGNVGEEYDVDAQESQLLTSDEEEGDLYGWTRSRPGRGDDLRDNGGGYSAELPLEDLCYDPARQQFLPAVTKYLADVHDHLIALTASVHHCERILARAHGNYLARINLELTHASNTTNQLATQMTVLAGIFLPLNLVAGIFGMNVKVPGRDRDDLRDFAIILGAMGFFVVASLAVCRWRRII